MNSSLKIILKEDSDKTEAFLTGEISEDSDFTILKNINSNLLILNLEGIKLINSCGIRDWVDFQYVLASNVKLVYRLCPQIIVEQMNMVSGFMKKGAMLESFYTPYYDELADEDVKVLLTPAMVINGKAPEMKNSSGEILEFDEIEQQYFHFLKHLQDSNEL
jgi:hypothetical protein